MDTRTGKKIRLGRLFNQRSGKTLIVAYSHGVIMGPQPGMRTLAEMRQVTQQLAQVDGLMIAPGMLTLLEDAFIGKERPSLFIHMDYQNITRSIIPYREGITVELARVEEALAAGADGVMTYLYLGYEDPERERIEIERNARLARACEQWGLVFMVEALSARERTHPEDKKDVAVLSLCCRVAAELGADVVKCHYPGSTEAIAEIAATCPVPWLQAGGARTADPEMAYQQAREAMNAGAAGLVFGRNIFEAPDPAAEVTRYRQIIHEE